MWATGKRLIPFPAYCRLMTSFKHCKIFTVTENESVAPALFASCVIYNTVCFHYCMFKVSYHVEYMHRCATRVLRNMSLENIGKGFMIFINSSRRMKRGIITSSISSVHHPICQSSRLWGWVSLLHIFVNTYTHVLTYIHRTPQLIVSFNSAFTLQRIT